MNGGVWSTEEEEEEEEDGKRDVGGHTRSFPAGSELCARAKGVSRQPEGVTPAYSYAGNEGNSRERRTRFYEASRPADNVSVRGLSRGERHASRTCFS